MPVAAGADAGLAELGRQDAPQRLGHLVEQLQLHPVSLPDGCDIADRRGLPRSPSVATHGGGATVGLGRSGPAGRRGRLGRLGPLAAAAGDEGLVEQAAGEAGEEVERPWRRGR